MDTDRKSRILFALANSGWTTLVVVACAGLAAVGLWGLGWTDSLGYVAFGAVAGAAVGAVRDPRIFQVMVALVGIVLMAFALYWADAGGMPAQALPLLGMALILFAATTLLIRVWSRERHVKVPTLAELDAAVTRPRMG